MIEVRGVRATPRELRPVLKAWPSERWMSVVPMLWLYGCMATTVFLWSRVPSHDLIPVVQLAMLLGMFVIGILLTRRTLRAVAASPTAGHAMDWVFDERGVRITSPVHEHSYDWRGVMRVVEDRDRFIVVISLATNHVLPMRVLTEDQKTGLRALIAEVAASGRMGAGA